MWFRGIYTSYTSFNSQIVGLFNTQVPQASSTSGTWSVDMDGLWSAVTNWSDGLIADGAGNTSDFSTLSLTANHTVTLDSSRTLGTLRFGDLSGLHNWTLNSTTGSALTLSAGAPAIVVNQNTATLSVPLAGTNGFTKSGPGTLVLNASNPLSGTLNLDSGSTTANDGAVDVTSSAALANVASPINLRNNSGVNAVASFQLDGSTGSINVNQSFSTTCRNNNTVPTFENLAGTNILSGTTQVQVGGTNVIYQADANSQLFVTAPIQYVGSLTAGRTFTFTGSGNVTLSAALLAASNNTAPISVVKNGSGTLTLSGTNTYTSNTTINSGTIRVDGILANGHVNIMAGALDGSGVINGPVNISATGTLNPGDDAVGALTINNVLTNAGSILIRLNKSGSGLTNASIQGMSTFVLGGTLNLTNIGPGIVTVGDSFKIFSATTFKNAFAAISPATPGIGLVWITNKLTVNGMLSVGLGTVRPTINNASRNGINLTFGGSGGAAGYSYSVLTSSNLITPRNAWNSIGTGIFDNFGTLLFTNRLTPGSSQQFYSIRIP